MDVISMIISTLGSINTKKKLSAAEILKSQENCWRFPTISRSMNVACSRRFTYNQIRQNWYFCICFESSQMSCGWYKLGVFINLRVTGSMFFCSMGKLSFYSINLRFFFSTAMGDNKFYVIGKNVCLSKCLAIFCSSLHLSSNSAEIYFASHTLWVD